MKRVLSIFSKNSSVFWIVIFFAFSLLLPIFVKSHFYVHVIILGILYAMLAVGFNFIFGFVGELSFAHSAFYGIGAYTTAILSIKFGISDWKAMLLSVLFALIGALIIGVPSLRFTRGPYFGIVTLAFALFLKLAVANGGALTGGPTGMPGIAGFKLINPFTGNISVLSTEISYYYLSMAFLWICLFISIGLAKSKVGKIWIATKENPDLAESVGIDTFSYNLLAFLIGAAMAGLAGSVYAFYTGFVSPKVLDPLITLTVATMVIIGGEGTILGPLIGTLLIAPLPEALRFARGLRDLIFGMMLLVTIMFAPGGIMGAVKHYFQAKGKSLE